MAIGHYSNHMLCIMNLKPGFPESNTLFLPIPTYSKTLVFVFVFVYVFRYYCINLHSRSEFHIFMRFDIKNDKENKISNAGFW